MARRLLKKITDKGGPIDSLLKLKNITPEIAKYAVTVTAKEIIHRSKDYLLHLEDPVDGPNVPWAPLSPDTPEWNKDSRKQRRDESDPLLDTGELAESIRCFKVYSYRLKATAEIGSRLEKAYILENGGRSNLPTPHARTPARPFLKPALLSVKADSRFKEMFRSRIRRRIKNAMEGKSVNLTVDLEIGG